MQSSLKKSLYLGLAAVSFVAAAGATTANASAKAATVKSDTTMTTAASSRNVTLTGTNAVYTKPGTVKGAKVVASTVTAKKLADSNKGAANFRAYRVAVTDRGSVYYKVVSFDGAYRGYVYGGKATDKFAAGLAAYNTTKDATAPKATDTFNLTATTSKDANTLFYAQPAYAQYKIGRATVNGSVLKATDKYAGAQFTFDKAATTSREGDTWYEIASTTLANGAKTTELNGAWVKASNVKNPKADPEATNDNSIKVVYRDATTKNPISGADKTFVTGATNTQAGHQYANELNNNGDHLDQFAVSSDNVPSGYMVAATQQDEAGQAVYGGTYFVNVTKTATSKATLYAYDGATKLTTPLDKTTLVTLPTLSTTDQQKLTGPVNTLMSTGDVTALTNALYNNQEEFYATTKNSDGKYNYYTVDTGKTEDANANTKYGDAFRIVLDLHQGKETELPSTSNNNNSNSDFLN